MYTYLSSISFSVL